MDIKKELFNTFQNTKDNYELYEGLVSYIDNVIKYTKGQENAKFYEHIIHLLNSINNARCEERRSEQIEYLWHIEREICDKYEDYLP